jgi:hypothetical protein
MEFQTCIKIKKKYNINLEKHLDSVFSRYGYHIVRNPEHYERSVVLYGDNSPWLTAASELFDSLDLAGLQKLASDISTVFKTITYIQAFSLAGVDSYYEFHLSSKHNAFEEPPYLKDGPTVLKRFIFAPGCQGGQPFTLHFINTGGISQGLEVYISGDFVERDTATFEPLNIHAYEYRKKDKNELKFEAPRQKLTLDGGRKVYFYDFPDFVFPEGINEFSATLGSKLACIFQRSVFLWMIPEGDQDALDTMHITILPKTNRDAGLQWQRFDPVI